ncbi:MAG: hypothetical protein ABI367_07155 [Mucilaginibacter sp.]
MENKPYSFKKLFWIYTFCFMPLCVLGGILALFNISAVTFNDTKRYGFEGFIIAILFIPFFALVWATMNCLALNFGNRLYSKFNDRFINR